MVALRIRKQPWSNIYRPEVIEAAALNPSASAAERYESRLDNLILRMTHETEMQIMHLFKSDTAQEYFAMDASIASQSRILTNKLMEKFEELFADHAKPLAEQNAYDADKNSDVSIKNSIHTLTKDLSLRTASLGGTQTDILTASIAENVALIKSIPQEYLNAVQGAVMRSITYKGGLKDLVPFLADRKGITLRRARMIAHDQTRKAYNGLASGKLLSLGIQEGSWLHSGGSNHPRPTHIAMTGKIFKLGEGLYDSAVGRFVLPGEEPNCRCRFKPVINFGVKENEH